MPARACARGIGGKECRCGAVLLRGDGALHGEAGAGGGPGGDGRRRRGVRYRAGRSRGIRLASLAADKDRRPSHPGRDAGPSAMTDPPALLPPEPQPKPRPRRSRSCRSPAHAIATAKPRPVGVRARVCRPGDGLAVDVAEPEPGEGGAAAAGAGCRGADTRADRPLKPNAGTQGGDAPGSAAVGAAGRGVGGPTTGASA